MRFKKLSGMPICTEVPVYMFFPVNLRLLFTCPSQCPISHSSGVVSYIIPVLLLKHIFTDLYDNSDGSFGIRCPVTAMYFLLLSNHSFFMYFKDTLFCIEAVKDHKHYVMSVFYKYAVYCPWETAEEFSEGR